MNEKYLNGKKIQMTQVKVWAYLEVIDEEQDLYQDAGLPHALMTFDDVTVESLPAIGIKLKSVLNLCETDMAESLSEIESILVENEQGEGPCES